MRFHFLFLFPFVRDNSHPFVDLSLCVSIAQLCPVVPNEACPHCLESKEHCVWNQWLLFQTFVQRIQLEPSVSCLDSECFFKSLDFFNFPRTMAAPAKFNKFCEWSHMRFRGGVKACITQASEEKYAPEEYRC